MSKENLILKAKHIGKYKTMATQRDAAGNPKIDEATGEVIQRRVTMHVFSLKGSAEAEEAFIESKRKDGLSEEQATRRHDDGGLIFHTFTKGSKKSYVEINGYSGNARLVDPVAEIYEDAIEDQQNDLLKNQVAAKVADRVVGSLEADIEAKLAEVDSMFNDTDDVAVDPKSVTLDEGDTGKKK